MAPVISCAGAILTAQLPRRGAGRRKRVPAVFESASQAERPVHRLRRSEQLPRLLRSPHRADAEPGSAGTIGCALRQGLLSVLLVQPLADVADDRVGSRHHAGLGSEYALSRHHPGRTDPAAGFPEETATSPPAPARSTTTAFRHRSARRDWTTRRAGR